jgi:hypothetical protein
VGSPAVDPLRRAYCSPLHSKYHFAVRGRVCGSFGQLYISFLVPSAVFFGVLVFAHVWGVTNMVIGLVGMSVLTVVIYTSAFVTVTDEGIRWNLLLVGRFTNWSEIERLVARRRSAALKLVPPLRAFSVFMYDSGWSERPIGQRLLRELEHRKIPIEDKRRRS